MGHSVVGLHFLKLGGIVRIMCISFGVSRISWALWLHMIMVDMPSLAGILAQ